MFFFVKDGVGGYLLINVQRNWVFATKSNFLIMHIFIYFINQIVLTSYISNLIFLVEQKSKFKILKVYDIRLLRYRDIVIKRFEFVAKTHFLLIVQNCVIIHSFNKNYILNFTFELWCSVLYCIEPYTFSFFFAALLLKMVFMNLMQHFTEKY